MWNRRLFICSAAITLVPVLGRAQGAVSSTAFIHGFDGLEGGRIRLSDFAGKPVLVVNTASFCGYTSQFSGLQALFTKYQARGLTIIGVPSNDFGGQEPGGPDETRSVAKSFGVAFPMAAKTKVIGADAHPFYRWAASQPPKDRPRWNFHKYLIGRGGQLAASFSTGIEPDSRELAAAIEAELPASG